MLVRRAPLRRVALLVGAAFAVHQLRFVLTYGDDAHRVLHEPGHRYLPFAAAAAGVLLLACAAQFGATLFRCLTGGRAPDRSPAGVGRLWVENALLLVATYVAQEGLEGAFTAGHPIWAHGGWVVLPLALVLGAVVAAVLVGAHRVLTEAARRAACRRPVRRGQTRQVPPRAVILAPLGALATHLAGRAPPVASTARRTPAAAALL